MNIVIIDDEKMAIDVLSIMLKSLTQFSVCIKGVYTNARDAFALFEKEQIDVVFLDMEMMDIHGLQVAKELLASYSELQIIFVTAHAQFAIGAFDTDATDYLLKPVREKRLVKAMTKAQEIYTVKQQQKPKSKGVKLFANLLGSFRLVDNQQTLVKWRTKKVRELFLYLWFYQNRPVLTTVIIEELWPEIEFEKAYANLHTTIYQLRKVLKQHGGENPILFVNNHYQLNVEIESDYDKLIALLEKQQQDDQSIQQILNYYEGDFLVEEEYAWAIQIQLRLRQNVLYVLEDCVAPPNKFNSLLTLNCLQKMLELDEFNEQYMLLLLQFLIEQNKKKECGQCYEMIQQKLLEELGVPVPENIKTLYEVYTMQG